MATGIISSSELPKSIQKIEHTEYFEYIGDAEALIAAGLFLPEQFPPAGSFGISFLNGSVVKGRCRVDETYRRIERHHDGSIHVWHGLPRDQLLIRRKARNETRRVADQALRAKWKADEEAKKREELEAIARRDRSDLASMPKTEHEYRRDVVQDLRSWVQHVVARQLTPHSHHGYTITQQTAESILTAADTMIEALMEGGINFDKALQEKIISERRANIRAEDPVFARHFAALSVVDSSILQGETS